MLSTHKRYYGLGMDALVISRILSKHERYYGLGMDALVTVFSQDTNVIMVSAWMHWQPYALETRTLLWFGHGCTGNRMLSTHKRYYGLGMDALVTVCSRNTNAVMVCAWMYWCLCRDAQVEEWSPRSAERRKTMQTNQKHQKRAQIARQSARARHQLPTLLYPQTINPKPKTLNPKS